MRRGRDVRKSLPTFLILDCGSLVGDWWRFTTQSFWQQKSWRFSKADKWLAPDAPETECDDNAQDTKRSAWDRSGIGDEDISPFPRIPEAFCLRAIWG